MSDWCVRIAAFLLTAMLVFPAAAADERFAVEVNVDVTDANASQAREKAMTAAYRAAFDEVCKRVTTPEGAARMAAMTDAQLINFIKEVAVIEEKTSAVRYLATLRVVLNEDMLREYMKERDVPLLMQTSSRILIIPLFREFSSDKPMLWENENMWRKAWETAPAANLVRFINIPATGMNYSIIDAEKAAAADGVALDKLMRVNNADDVYVLDATYDGIDGLIINATSYSGDRRVIRVSGARSSGMQLFMDAVPQVEQQLEGKIRQESLRESSQENQEIILFNFSSLMQWVDAERSLRSIPFVKNIEIQAMGTNKVQFKLVFAGAYDKLISALKAKSYELNERDGYLLMEKTED